MSRIGKKPVEVPAGVKVTIENGVVELEGPKGKLSLTILPNVDVVFEDNSLKVSITAEDRQTRAFFGLMRALLANNVIGVSKGYERKLQLVGTGYIAAVQGTQLQLRVGFANEIHVEIPADLACPLLQQLYEAGCQDHSQGIELAQPGHQNSGKGKGIRYENEQVRRKERKNVGK